MLVACREVDAAKWLAAAAVRAAKPVLFYREFSAVEQPAGRYWFADESPFHRLDISFHSIEEHLAGYHNVPRMEECGEMRVAYKATTSDELATPSLPPYPRLSISAREAEIGRHIYRLTNSLKTQLRGEDRTAEVTARAAELRASLGELTRESTLEGGRIGELAHQLLAIARSASPVRSCAVRGRRVSDGTRQE